MVASKAFVTLVLAVVALAAPSRRQITEPPPEDRVTCTYVLTPDPPVVDDSTLDGDHKFDWNGSYEVNATTASNGLSADELKAIVTAWPGSTLQGRFVVEWEVGSVTCQDSAADTGDVEGVKFSL
ncbi:hypothetical protein AAF712_011290 [Marasmius tenuissimus]|uniref:Uncharacterized protein n=1 Tax=Marasmius tenuissimus TaxID=585030 RepID=A0ABR2ZMA4_9AGAR